MIIKKTIIFFVRSYQHIISPGLPSQCRFYPTCSEYCVQAVDKHGVFRGLYLFFKRFLRCHPFSKGGIDSVP